MFDKIKTAEILEDLRKPNGKTKYSFEALSKAIEEKTGVKISHTQLMNYENNDITNKDKHIMNVDYAIAIAEFYEVSLEYLLGLTPHQTIDVTTREICEITGFSEKSLEKLNKMNHNTVLFLEDGEKKYVIQTTQKNIEKFTKNGAKLIRTLTKDYNIKVINTLLEFDIGVKIIDNLSNFLFSDFVNSDKANKADTGAYFRVQRKGQDTIEFISTEELNATYLLKAQAELLELKKQLERGVENNGR